MKNGICLIAALTVGLITSSMAFAEGRDGGGGVGFLCHEKGGDKVYLADTYQLVKSGKLKGYEDVDLGIVLAAAAQTINEKQSNGADGSLLNATLAARNSALQWQKQSPLPLLGDDHIPADQVPANCEKVQLVIQDVSTRVVHYDDKLVNQLTGTEIAFLNVHETLISIRNEPGADTTPIRAQVASVLDSTKFVDLVKLVITPNWQLDVQANNPHYKKLLMDVVGEYTGVDTDTTHKDPCHVSIRLKGNMIAASLEVTYGNGQKRKISPPAISINRLVNSMIADAKFRAANRGYCAECTETNYHDYISFSTVLGLFERTTNEINLYWYDDKFASLTLADTFGDSGLMCMYLKADH